MKKYWAQEKNVVPHDQYVNSQIDSMKLKEIYLAADVEQVLKDAKDLAANVIDTAEVVGLRVTLKREIRTATRLLERLR